MCPKPMAASLPSGSPLTDPPSLDFLDPVPSPFTLKTPNADWGLPAAWTRLLPL